MNISIYIIEQNVYRKRNKYTHGDDEEYEKKKNKRKLKESK